MVYLERNWSRVWAARNRAAMDVWLCWFAAVLKLDENGASPCNFSKSGGGLLLGERSAEAQTRHISFVGRNGESSG